MCSQFGDGVVGPIQIDGPHSGNYDVDLGTYPVNDWFYQTSFEINSLALQNLQEFQAPPPADNILINGTNKNPVNGGGKYNQVRTKLRCESLSFIAQDALCATYMAQTS